MSTGRSESKRAARRAEAAAATDRQTRLKSEDRLKREKARSQQLFVRQLRARLGGGFFESQTRDTLG